MVLPYINMNPPQVYTRIILRGLIWKTYSTWLHNIRRVQRRQWQATPVFLPGKSHGQRSLVGWSPWGLEESYTTERLHFHFSLSCIGEGNGNTFQCSCLENPREGGAWWAAVYGVAQSRTWLKRLSSSSSSSRDFLGGQGLRILLAMQGTWVQFLLGELRSYMQSPWQLSPRTTTAEPKYHNEDTPCCN